MLRLVVARIFPLLALLVLVPPASASIIEQVSGAVYQDDAFRPGDASDLCERARPITLPADFTGLVVAQDDVLDFYAFDVPASRVGLPVTLELEAWRNLHSDAVPVEVRPDLDLYVYERGCGEYLASARTYNGSEELRFVPLHAGGYVALVLLYAPVADVPARTGIPAPLEQLGYALSVR